MAYESNFALGKRKCYYGWGTGPDIPLYSGHKFVTSSDSRRFLACLFFRSSPKASAKQSSISRCAKKVSTRGNLRRVKQCACFGQDEFSTPRSISSKFNIRCDAILFLVDEFRGPRQSIFVFTLLYSYSFSPWTLSSMNQFLMDSCFFLSFLPFPFHDSVTTDRVLQSMVAITIPLLVGNETLASPGTSAQNVQKVTRNLHRIKRCQKTIHQKPEQPLTVGFHILVFMVNFQTQTIIMGCAESCFIHSNSH